jgi:hypothetical protein
MTSRFIRNSKSSKSWAIPLLVLPLTDELPTQILSVKGSGSHTFKVRWEWACYTRYFFFCQALAWLPLRGLGFVFGFYAPSTLLSETQERTDCKKISCSCQLIFFLQSVVIELSKGGAVAYGM